MTRCALLALTLATAGCVRQTYTLPPSEAVRIAQSPPAERAAVLSRVRVVQDTPLTRGPACLPRRTAPTPIREGQTFTVRSVGLSGTAPTDPGPPGACRPETRGQRQAEALVASIALLALPITAVLTEGERFDGWASLSVDHPVHLLYPAGRERRTRLGALRPQDLPRGTRTVLRARDAGQQIAPLQRAPLDRVGFMGHADVGPSQIPLPDGGDVIGAATRLQLGWFPWQQVGFLWGVDLAGEVGGASAFQIHSEARYMPLDLGRLHLGVSGVVGALVVDPSAAENPPAEIGLGLSAGAIIELELTTRIALSTRLGGQWWLQGDRDPSDVALGGAIGLTVY